MLFFYFLSQIGDCECKKEFIHDSDTLSINWFSLQSSIDI